MSCWNDAFLRGADNETNPSTKIYDTYYRLVESYRNAMGRVCHGTILNVGLIADIATLETVINKLSSHRSDGPKPSVVQEAGITTRENLDLLKHKGYHYMCEPQ